MTGAAALKRPDSRKRIIVVEGTIVIVGNVGERSGFERSGFERSGLERSGLNGVALNTVALNTVALNAKN